MKRAMIMFLFCAVAATACNNCANEEGEYVPPEATSEAAQADAG